MVDSGIFQTLELGPKKRQSEVTEAVWRNALPFAKRIKK